MSATKSKPAGRAVKVEPVYESAFTGRWIEHGVGINKADRQKAHLITGYTGSANKLKRLVEIAGMDESELHNTIHSALANAGPASCYGMATTVIEALGLSTAQGRRRKQP